MTIEQRVENLENLVGSLIRMMNATKFYTDADIAGVRQNISDVDQKIENDVYPSWNGDGYDYFAGERVSYGEKYYRCIQNHKSQSDWTPDKTVSLWVEVSNDPQEFPEWKQPTGAQDAYAKWDKVSHLSKHWVSDIDANVYEPGIYGWSEV